MQKINLNEVDFSIESLPTEEQLNRLTPFEQSTLKFCNEWESGKREFILTTSGSTGTPKEISITREQMSKSAHATIQTLGLLAGMSALICLDTKFIAGKMMLVRCLAGNLTMIAVEPSSNPFEKLDEDVTIDFVALIPYQLHTILHSAQRNRFNKIKKAIIGGGALEASLVKKLNEFTCEFYATYGMTETVSHIALQRLNGLNADKSFKTLPNVSIAQDERDCLIIEADFIKNKRVITNDIVELCSANEFRWLGRWDNVINSGGIKIFPEEVEKEISNVLNEHQYTNRFFVAGLPDEKLGNKLVLVVEGTIPNSIIETLKAKLPRYKNPKMVCAIEKFIETPTGKINRKETLARIPSAKLSQ